MVKVKGELCDYLMENFYHENWLWIESKHAGSICIDKQTLSEQNRTEAIKANEMLSLQAIRLIEGSLKAIDDGVLLNTWDASPILSITYVFSNICYRDFK